MAAIVIRDNAKATWLTGPAGVRAKACDMVQRAMACAAAAILICTVAAALVQLAAELLSFPAPIAVTAMTLMAAALLNSLCRHLRTSARHRSGPGTRLACSDKPASLPRCADSSSMSNRAACGSADGRLRSNRWTRPTCGMRALNHDRPAADEDDCQAAAHGRVPAERPTRLACAVPPQP
jgi:hypothetical protein